jgi:hypothetical protein
MLAAIIVLLSCLVIYLLVQWGLTSVKENQRGFENGIRAYQEKTERYALTHPDHTAIQMYNQIRIDL